MADEMNTDERAAPSDEDFVMIYKRANGEDTGKAQPLTTKRIVNAMRAAFQAGRASTGFTAADMATASAQGFRDGVASLSAAEPADDAIFEFWWADHMPNATQSEAWAEWCALRSNQPAEPAIPALQPVLWALYDSRGFYEIRETEEQAKRFCDHYNQQRTVDPLKPYTYKPLYTHPAPALTQGAAIAAGAVYAELPARRRAFLCTKCGGRECEPETLGQVNPACKCGYLGFAEDLDFTVDDLRDFADRTHAIRIASHGQAPAQPLTVAQIEEAIGLRSKAWDTLGAEKIVESVLQMVNRQAPAQPDAPLPLLVRDIAAELGITAPQACKSLFAAGCGETSVNMAVTPRMARALRAMHPTPSPQAAQQAPTRLWNPLDGGNQETALQMAAVIAHRDEQQAPAGATSWEYSKIESRIKELMAGTAHPNSTSVAQAMKQLVNELWQEYGQPAAPAAPAAPSTPEAGGWLPMETAPKDGTELLLWREDCGHLIGSYTSADGFPLTQEEIDGMDEETLFAKDWFTQWPQALRLDGSEMPTHWQPLPASPTIEGESNG